MSLCTALTQAVITASYTPAEADKHPNKMPPEKLLGRKHSARSVGLSDDTVATACADGKSLLCMAASCQQYL